MITIDKVELKVKPTKECYKALLVIFRKHFQKFCVTKIECFEKNKLKRLHYHGIIFSDNFLVYDKFKASGYSIKLKYLKTPEDIIRATEYIIKGKVDGIDVKQLKKPIIKKQDPLADIKSMYTLDPLIHVNDHINE